MIFDNLDKYTTESVLQGHPDKICDQILFGRDRRIADGDADETSDLPG